LQYKNQPTGLTQRGLSHIRAAGGRFCDATPGGSKLTFLVLAHDVSLAFVLPGER
jgi:hypothetical protein